MHSLATEQGYLCHGVCEKTQRFVLVAGLVIGKPFDCLSVVDFATL